MELLRRQIRHISYDDVRSFCQQSVSEGIQLDYKKDLSDKGLAKHLAAFSNARGGIIIIGVEEDSATGKPKKWEGVDLSGKPEDRIHQYACNVDPVPNYEIAVTNSGPDGKAFVLIRIWEGAYTPYYVINDATIYVRTGNTTKRCEESASPQETARLFAKREGAELARRNGVKRAEIVYESVTARFQKQHRRWHKQNRPTTVHSVASQPTAGICSVVIQPYCPDRALSSPRELAVKMNHIGSGQNASRHWFGSFNYEAMQDGVLFIKAHTEDGARLESCQAVFATGSIFGRDALPSSISGSISVTDICEELYFFLIISRDIYRVLGYQGSLVGHIEIQSVGGMQVRALTAKNESRFDPRDVLLSSYLWEIETDTSVLFDPGSLKNFFYEFVNDIGWSLGWDYDHTSALDTHVMQRGWSF